MPELPEVETVRLGLERQLTGAVITGVAVGDFAGVVEGMTVKQFRDAVVGRRFTAARRRGKYLLLDLDNDLSIMVHLRMTGQLTVVPGGSPSLRFEHLRLMLADGRELRFADQRKFGRVALLTPKQVVALDRKLGVEPLSRRFTAEWLTAAFSGRSGMVKALLLDQSLIAGIGNIYADEALFRARIHPMTPADTLTPEQVRRLHRALRLVLRQAIDRRGTTFSSYRDSQGEAGENQFTLLVYGLGRKGAFCPRCGRELVCIQVAGRSSHLCPHCQPLPSRMGSVGA